MLQLSGLDNSFLVMEAGGQFGHVGSLCLYDTSHLEGASLYDELRETLIERLHLLPPYRRRLVEVPFDLDRPYWIEDPEFDLDFHLRHIAVPPPGDERQLSELISRLHARPLDRSRPLWEIYVIEGVEGGLTGIYTKIHHCTIDGVSGAQMMEVLLDRSPQAPPPAPPEKPWQPDRLPGSVEMFWRGVGGAVRQPGRSARTVYRTARDLWQQNEALGAVARTLGLDQLPLAGSWLRRRGPQLDADPIPQTPAPRTPFNRSITPHRRFAYFSMPLDRVREVKRVFGTTLNDVVMAISSGALRRYLAEKGELPNDPLIAMVPVSVRSESQRGEFTNRVTSVLAELATDEEDPVRRLQRIHEVMATAKRMQQAMPATLLQDWSEIATPALFAQAMRIVARTKIMDRMRPPFNVVISNVPGPRDSLYCGRAELQTYTPVSAVAEGQGLNITVQSYRNQLDWGLISCRELVPDVWRFEALYGEALEELEKAAALAAPPSA